MYLRLAEFLSQKAWVCKSQNLQITKMQIPPPKKKSWARKSHLQKVCKSNKLFFKFTNLRFCDLQNLFVDRTNSDDNLVL
jgi:hypothetical protein